jgi:hypothetical protein
MCRRAQGKGLLGGVGHEELFTGNADALPAETRINLSGVCLQPGRIAIKEIALRSRSGQFLRIRNLFHNNRDLTICHVSALQQRIRVSVRRRAGRLLYDDADRYRPR